MQQRFTNQLAIASGASGEIFSAKDKKKNRDVILKVIPSYHQSSFDKEVECLQKLKHENILKMYAKGKTNNPGSANVVVLEKMECDLYTYLSDNNITKNKAVYIISSVLKAVEYCHSKNVAHLDIKPENILVSNNAKSVKLCDFGGSATWTSNDPLVCETSSTTEYCAPEVLNDATFSGAKADMWSVGILLHILLSGCWPYVGETDEELEANIKNSKITISNCVPVEFLPLLNVLLSLDPETRPSATKTLLMLQQLMRPKLTQKPLKQSVEKHLARGCLYFSF